MNLHELSKEELIKFIEENENTTGKYGLTLDKEKEPEETVVNCSKNISILSEKEEMNIMNNSDDITNVLISGDNFHSLSVLNYTHKEKIDIIYIDPPYNTGNKDFIYNDKFVVQEDGYRHSKWLNFMSKRIRLARDLLKETGTIFISIDDNEQAQLKLLCDKVFGSINCLGILPTIMNLKGNQDQFGFAGTHEYTLAYAKNKSLCELGQFNIDDDEIEKEWEQDEIGYFKKGATLRATGVDSDREKRPYMFYPVLIKNDEVSMITEEEYSKIYDSSSKEFDDNYLDNLVSKYSSEGYDVLLPKNPNGTYGRWRWGFQSMINNKNEIIINNTNGISLYKKQRPTIGDIPTKKPKSLLYKAEYSSGNGTSQLEKILGSKKFDNPKPVELIKDLIRIGSQNKDSLVLDFFAGSGTTGQAVMELNKEDGGNRKFILCTNNENNIFDEVTYPRLKTVITGVRTDGSKYSNGLDFNLKVYETAFVENSNNRDQLYFDLTERCIPMLCMKSECFEEYKSSDEYKIYVNKDKTRYACVYYSLFGEKEEEFIEELRNIKEEKYLYKFTLGDTPDMTKYKDLTNYEVEAIPYKIVELYKKIVKMSRED